VSAKSVHGDEWNRHEHRNAGAGRTPAEGFAAGGAGRAGELVGAAKDGLLVLSVGVGLGVLSEMMEAEPDEVVGPKHAPRSQSAPRSVTVTRTAK